MDERRPDPLDYQQPIREHPQARRRRLDAREDSGCLAAVLLVCAWPLWLCCVVMPVGNWLGALLHDEVFLWLFPGLIFGPLVLAIVIGLASRLPW